MTINGNFTPAGPVTLDVVPPAASAGTDYDQYIVNGNVDLSGAFLNFMTPTNGAVAPQQVVTLFVNNSLNSTTAAPSPGNGTVVTIGGVSYRIYYNAGDGNDVVLIENSPPPVPSTVYVDDLNFGLGASPSTGTPVPDADFGVGGNQRAT